MIQVYSREMELTLLFFVLTFYLARAGEFTFELPDNEKQCFHEVIDKDVTCTIEYQVITGGNYDVDMELFAPNGNYLYKETKKQYDTHTWKTLEKGEYKFCFSNEFSTFTHKVVYFDFEVGDEDDDFLDIEENGPTAMTQMETSAITIHEALKVIIDYQTHHRLRESKGRGFAEELNRKVQFWSVGEFAVILMIGIGQVIVLRGFFTDKKSIVRT